MVDEMSVAAADEAVVTEDMIAALKGGVLRPFGGHLLPAVDG